VLSGLIASRVTRDDTRAFSTDYSLSDWRSSSLRPPPVCHTVLEIPFAEDRIAGAIVIPCHDVRNQQDLSRPSMRPMASPAEPVEPDRLECPPSASGGI